MSSFLHLRVRYPLFSRRLWLRRLVFWLGAVAVALAAILFAWTSTQATNVIFAIAGVSPLIPFVLAPAGFALGRFVTRRWFPGAEGSGIPQCIAALDLPDQARRSVLSLRLAFGKVLLTTIGLATGASVGREGPTVQVAASIMYGFGRLLKVRRPEFDRALILAGSAAGIAAAFNTPIAGIVFAIEELSRSFEERTSGTVLTAVIVSGFTAIAVMGNYTYFGHTSASLDLGSAWRPVLFCGVAGGLLGGLFARILIYFAQGVPGRVGALIKAHPIAFSALCGLATAALGFVSDNAVYGTGYNQAKMLLEGTGHLPWHFGLDKLATTALSYLSGIPGGIFAPSLAVGAGLGASVAGWFPSAPASAVVILGMAAYFSGAVQSPITAVVIVMEMTDNQSLTVPLMASAAIAYGSSRLICHTSVYRALAASFLQRTALRAPAATPGDAPA